MMEERKSEEGKGEIIVDEKKEENEEKIVFSQGGGEGKGVLRIADGGT